MLRETQIQQIFAEKKAIITGDHFVYAKKADGWYHGDAYVNKDAIYPYVDEVSLLCQCIAQSFVHDGIEVVVGPTVGAVRLSSWVSHWLKRFTYSEVLDVCADEEDIFAPREIKSDLELEFNAFGKVRISCSLIGGGMRVTFFEKAGTRRVIKRGYGQHIKGRRCLIVEDVINSGATVAKTRDAVIELGGKVVAVAALCNRSGGKVTAQSLGVAEIHSLVDVSMEMFKEDENGFCSICKKRGRGSVRLDLGWGKEFLYRFGLKPGDS